MAFPTMHPNYLNRLRDQEYKNLELELEVYKDFIVKQTDEHSKKVAQLVRENDQLRSNATYMPVNNNTTRIVQLENELSDTVRKLEFEKQKSVQLSEARNELERKLAEAQHNLSKQKEEGEERTRASENRILELQKTNKRLQLDSEKGGYEKFIQKFESLSVEQKIMAEKYALLERELAVHRANHAARSHQPESGTSAHSPYENRQYFYNNQRSSVATIPSESFPT